MASWKLPLGEMKEIVKRREFNIDFNDFMKE